MERIKVLIVDDDKIIINGLLSMANWEKLGFEVVATAINGKQGLARFQKHSPQVVFTDVKMPVMDGLEMIRAIKSENEFARFIILSAFGDFHYAKQALELGASYYILKEDLDPDTLPPLLEKIRMDLVAQARSAFESIQDTVLSALQGGRLNSDKTIVDIEDQFERYLDINATESGLLLLSKQLDRMISQTFERLGKSAFYAEPPYTDRDALRIWIVEQLRRIDDWKRVERQHLSPIIANAVFYIRENCCRKDFSVRAISEHVSMSEGRLSVLFKQEVGQTMKEYVTSLQVERAKSLLQQGRYRIYEIAELLGFSSPEYFGRFFTKATGSSPFRYRKEDDEV